MRRIRRTEGYWFPAQFFEISTSEVLSKQADPPALTHQGFLLQFSLIAEGSTILLGFIDHGGIIIILAVGLGHMYRHIWKGVRVRFVSSLLIKPRAVESGRKNVAGKLEFLRYVATTGGRDYIGYGGESITGPIQVQIVDALRAGDRKKASRLLSALCHGNDPQEAADFLYILEYCMRTPDPLFAMETWSSMEEKGIGVTELCCCFIVQALCKGGYLEEAFNMLKYFGEKYCIYPLLPLYNSVLKSCIQMRSLLHVKLCLDLMDQQSVGKNEATYWELLELAVWLQNLSAANEVWREYIKYYSPNMLFLRKFIWCFARLNDLRAAYNTLQYMVALALKGSHFVIRNTDGNLAFSRLDIPVRTEGELSSKPSGIEQIEHPPTVGVNCKEMDSLSVDTGKHEIATSGEPTISRLKMGDMHEEMLHRKELAWSFNEVIHAFARSRNRRIAEQLMFQMLTLGLQPCSYTYDGYIRAIVSKKGGVHDGLEILKTMEQQDLKPNDSTLATLAVGCSEVLELDLSEALLEQISETTDIYPFNSYLMACEALGLPERALPILSKMKQLKVKPDIRTYELLFSLYGHVNAPYEKGNQLSHEDVARRVKAIEMDMAKNGIQHSQISINNLLKALGNEGMVEAMIQYMQIAENQFYLTNTNLGTSICNTVLHSLVESKETGLATEIYKKMRSCGISSDAATYTIMIDCCSYMKCFASASALVSVMIRDGFLPKTVAYTVLIKVVLQHEDFDRALHFLDQVYKDRMVPDLLLYNTILKGACWEGRFDIAESIIDQMHQRDIKPDPSTCSYMFRAYVRSGFLSTAMETLYILSMWMISAEASTWEANKLEFEDFIYSEDSEAELRILPLFKDHKDDLAFGLLQLRWLAIVGYSMS